MVPVILGEERPSPRHRPLPLEEPERLALALARLSETRERGQMSNFEAIKAEATRLSPWAHLATVGEDGEPDVAPVHPAWEGDELWIMVDSTSIKVRNIAVQPKVAMHWQVTEAGDGVEIWGTATLHEDLETKRRLWTGIFDYDLSLFSPGGPDGSPTTAFVHVLPERAVALRFYGINGTTRWRRHD